MAIVPYTGADTRGIPGMHADMQEWNALTRLADNVAAAPIGPGQPVASFGGDGKLGRAWTTGKALGVARYGIHVDTTAGFAEGEAIAVQNQGTMWVAAGAAATAEAAAGYNPALDRWANVGGAYVAVPGVEFSTTGVANGLVKIRIAIPTTVAA